MMRSDENEGEIIRDRELSHYIPTLFRIGAFVMIIVGFIGLLTVDSTVLNISNQYTVIFGIGVIFAILSIYLGIYLHTPE